jgi:hypothetical protein
MRVGTRRAILGVAVAGALAFLPWGCGGGDGGNPSGPSNPGGTPPPSAATTITISANGVDPKTVRIEAGQAVRFVNSDGSVRVPSSDPHPVHSDCPAINSAGTLSPGASGTTGALNAVRACGFHDHNNPDDSRFRGQIVVGDAREMPGY